MVTYSLPLEPNPPLPPRRPDRCARSIVSTNAATSRAHSSSCRSQASKEGAGHMPGSNTASMAPSVKVPDRTSTEIAFSGGRAIGGPSCNSTSRAFNSSHSSSSKRCRSARASRHAGRAAATPAINAIAPRRRSVARYQPRTIAPPVSGKAGSCSNSGATVRRVEMTLIPAFDSRISTNDGLSRAPHTHGESPLPVPIRTRR